MRSPLLGFNNNVNYRGRVFHIQTEDSGVRYPHVITHLFVDGGRILETYKATYAQHVDSEQLADVVRALMKEQHKKMLIALRDGLFDPLLAADALSGTRTSSTASSTSFQAVPAPAPAAQQPASTSTKDTRIESHATNQVLPPAPASEARNKSPSGLYPASKRSSDLSDGPISAKSLDEVILSYLSEDLETAETKQ